MIPRMYFEPIREALIDGRKIVVLYGPRQAGKTTLIKSIIDQLDFRTLFINADQQRYIDILSSRDLERMKWLIAGHEVLVIDEAQRVPDIGINLKILHDEMPQLRIIATGSSSFELANQVKEPLTGRILTFVLYPIGVCELALSQNPFELQSQIEAFLRFGMYPERFSMQGADETANYLVDIASSYLYKDVLELSNIRHSSKLHKLLQLLAHQIGAQVSLNELGQQLEMSKDTVGHYLDLLEQSFVIFRLPGFSRNLRKELSKMDKIYFWDTGVRNAVIDDFRPLSSRSDTGKLWENFLVSERRKWLAFHQKRGRSHFWRTYDQAEIDYVETKDGQIQAYEFKFFPKAARVPQAWQLAYPEASFQVVHPENFWEFVG